MINVNEVIQKFPAVSDGKMVHKPAKALMSYLLHERDFHAFEQQYSHLDGVEFVEQVFDYFDFGYKVLDHHRERIPSSGRIVIIANHPIGSLDGLALIKLVSEVRDDVKIVANDMLMAIKPLHSLLLPVSVFGGRTKKENLQAIQSHLDSEGALIIFPAGEVSRVRPNGIRDTKWHTGFVRIARSAKAPILPVHIDGRNSALFYGASMLYKPLATLLLVKEMFKHQCGHLDIKIGEMIPYESYHNPDEPVGTTVTKFKQHLYRLPKSRKLRARKKPIFETEPPIALPENKLIIRRELESSELLGETSDGKQIYLIQHLKSSALLREIGRLREMTFRAVGEGTGRRRDTDKYDSYYYHLVLWDKENLEIAGAYRFADVSYVFDRVSENGLYTQTLARYSDSAKPLIRQGLELGRSFVQPRYQGKRALDYLWFGIGAFLKSRPQYRYLFGPVSLSNNYPAQAKDLMVYFYSMYFGATEHLATSMQPYQLSADSSHIASLFKGNDYKADFTVLKQSLNEMGVNVPTLYKQYTELCEPGGVTFLDFGVDPDFGDCVDGLVMVDMTQLKEKKRLRYLA